MKLLVVAFQMSPAQGSEYSVGWGWVRELAKKHRVTVITNDAARADIEAFTRNRDKADFPVDFQFVTWSQRWIHSRLWSLVRIFQYGRWRRAALVKAKELAASGGYDACHHINSVGFRDVVPLWETGLPFVWGPVGGAVFAPGELLPALSHGTRVFFILKNIANFLALRFSRRPRLAASKAHRIIAATPKIQHRIRHYWQAESIVVPEVGLPGEVSEDAAERILANPLRIVWCGRLVEGKVLNILLRALPLIRRVVDWQLDVIGDGPKRSAWEDLARSLGVADRVTFHGALPRQDVVARMRTGHVFVMTSVYDLTTNVLCEAMAAGLPVICLSHHAAARYVGTSAGRVVPTGPVDAVCNGIAREIERLYDNESERRVLADAALEVARRFSWERKGEELDGIYGSIDSVSTSRPL